MPHTDKSANSWCKDWANTAPRKETTINLEWAETPAEVKEKITIFPNASRGKENSLVPHYTWNIVDASKLETYMECPRRFFYKYVLGWDNEYSSHDLEFGSAWHLAMEHILRTNYSVENIALAHELFRNHYERYFPIETQFELEPKSSSGALLALAGYCSKYIDDHSNFKVLYTEVSGSITVLKGRIMNFRMDTIIEDSEKGICSLEHKTAKSLERTFQDKWILHMQPNLYTHVLYCLFPVDSVYGVIINGTALYKQTARTKRPPAEYLRIPCRRTPEMMNTWLHNLDHWLDLLFDDYDRMSVTSDSDDTMVAFPQNTTNCTQYWGCRFHDFCIGWANPLRYCADVPTGFIQRYWDPANPTDKPAPRFEVSDGVIKQKEVTL
jgi:hypothetical protein